MAGLNAISPPLVLGLAFAPTASSIPDATDVNARLDRIDFAADFVIALVFSDDPAFGDPADNTAIAIPPEVIAHTPTAATDVPISVRPTVTFDATMDPATLTPLTFTLQLGGVPVGASVAYDVGSQTATLTPDLYLEVDTDYIVTVTTGVHDTGDTPLAADVSFSFRTSVCGQAPIELGTAESFAVLAASIITNTGGTTVTGNLGLSPGTSVVGFPPGIVNGEIHITDAAAAAAQADMAAAFNEAAGRNVCPNVVDELGGLTLLPGLYQAATTLSVATGNLTLDAADDSRAVFVFQAGSALNIGTGRSITLIRGALATNVFWVVGSSATIEVSSIMAGTVLADQSITLQTDAILNGRAFAHVAAVTLDTNTVVTLP